MSALPRPTPVDPVEARFWELLATGALHLQRCRSCKTYRHPPRPTCGACGSADDEWMRSTGSGEVWSYTVIHPPTLPAFDDRTPYGAVVVRLDEGVFVVSNVVDCPVDELAVGRRVEVVVTEVEDGLWLPLFR